MATATAPAKPNASRLAGLLPLVLGAAILVIVFGVGVNTLLPMPIEAAEDLHLDPPLVVEGGFEVTAINTGGVELTIAQVLVDDAYRTHEVEPARVLQPLDRAKIIIPYPWVEGEAHEIVVLTHTGTDFGAEVEVAVAAPTIDGDFFLRFLAVGILVGVLPVGLGMSFLPFLRRADPRVERFVLALTVGLLAFLAIDGVEEGLEIAHEVAPIYNPIGLFALTVVAAVLLVLGLGQLGSRGGTAGPVALAWLIAAGIGLHNFGEGLAIGAAWAGGAIPFGAALVIGFTLHNVTEGPAIIAPATKEKVRLRTWLGMLALAGLPAVFGGWVGGASPDPTLVLSFLGLGVGAIVVVAIQVGGQMRQRDAKALSRPEVLAGLGAGLLVMWLTGLYVAL